MSKIKRLCIYFFYDKDGIVDRYVFNMLSAIKPFTEEIIFVSNGALQKKSKDRLINLVTTVTERPNVGFDVWAYKETLENYTWLKLLKFDEIIMMNHTIMGPIYPLEEVFAKMDCLDLDFWGLTVYHALPNDPMGKCKYGFIPLHLQSHFIAVRRSLFSSNSFHNYWSNMHSVHSYEEAVCFHEAIFTKTFSDLGYRWCAYADSEKLVKHNYCPIIYSPTKLIKETRCPIFKRRSFFHNYDDLRAWSLGNQAKELIDYLQKQTNYNIDYIWENILRTCNLADIQLCLGRMFVLPDATPDTNFFNKLKIALFLHIYNEDQIDFCLKYANSMPEDSDIYVTTSSQQNKGQIEQAFSNSGLKCLNVTVIQNRGRDVSALLVNGRQIIEQHDYDLICFAHDKKSHNPDTAIIGESFARHCFENILGSPAFVSSIIKQFQQNPHLGILSPPPPFHADYVKVIGDEWTCNFSRTIALANSLSINVPIHPYKPPIAPLGTMFWFRPHAMSHLFKHEWKYEDFPKEPNELDGTLLHAIERLYPFAAQAKGYYSAWCLEENYAENYLSTIYYLLRKESYQCRNGSIVKYIFLRIKGKLKQILPHSFWKLLKKLYYKMLKIS